MALFLLPRIHRYNGCLRPFLLALFNKYSSDKVLNMEEDVIEDFTTQLLNNRKKAKSFNLSNKIQSRVVVKNLDTKSQHLILKTLDLEDLNRQFLNLTEENNARDVKQLVIECRKSGICPSINMVLLMLQNFSLNGDISVINEIVAMVKSCNNNLYVEYSNFDSYMAAAFWVNGNILQALQLFEKVYKDNAYLRRTVRLTIRHLILDVTRNSSEAILVNITKFIESIYYEYEDVYLLKYLWQACFLSEWYADQTVALELLEKHVGLREIIGSNVSHVVLVLLKSGRPEGVYRLLEVLLKYEMKSQYIVVVVALFEYKMRVKDVLAATEIIRWAVSNEIVLPSSVYERFIMVLLKKPYRPSKAAKKQENSGQQKLDFKF